MTISRAFAASLIFALAVATAPVVAHAKKAAPAAGGPAPACNFKSIPFVVGNTWTYKSGPQSLIIKVTEVGPGKDELGHAATVITTEEQYLGRTVKAQHSCTAAGMVLSLDSFFFSGEPGGGTLSTAAVTSRDKPSFLPEEQLTDGNGWVETVKADIARKDGDGAGAQHLQAKIEVERHVAVKTSESVMLQVGQFTAQRVEIELRGRGIVGEEKVEIPIKRPAEVWMAKGIGVVKFQDAFDKNWELAESNLMPK
jgi:hypothetical protein